MEKIPEHVLMIDVRILSIEEDFVGIESISFLTSSIVSGSRSRKGSSLKVPSNHNGSMVLPANLAVIAALTDLILFVKKLEKECLTSQVHLDRSRWVQHILTGGPASSHIRPSSLNLLRVVPTSWGDDSFVGDTTSLLVFRSVVLETTCLLQPFQLLSLAFHLI